MSQRYICVHGHFYQPPRENAWLEVVETQETAAPFHDWNARINHECYGPNAFSRILNSKGQIVDIVNNYRKISFNFGPTLLSWLEANDPDTYAAILEADRLSVKDRNGHGNALAQAHSHLILPLCNTRDKETQVIWGIKDFEHRFGRSPEGMWLAETAMDTASLEVLAANGIAFTIAAPRQAKAVRQIGESNWKDLTAGAVNPRQPYLCRLPSGKSIVIFFYDGNVSQAVAFEGLLNNGKAFADRLMTGFTTNNKEEELLHIATDGESYGHHHRHGDMALAFCLNHIEENKMAKLTNYGEFLAMNPPSWEVMIHENSSWSCAHGVERWKNDCGCNSGGKPGWHQKWRAPLRNALDRLRDKLIPIFEKETEGLLKDCWKARNDYIQVILDRSEANLEDFWNIHANRKLAEAEKVKTLRLLEMQRNALYMYTSCGWFFDEVTGIETTQILQYACRAIDYAGQTANVSLEEEFMGLLEKIPSNVKEYGDAAVSYTKNVIPSRVGLDRVGMHIAVTALLEKEPEQFVSLFNYTIKNDSFEKIKAGNYSLMLGRTTVKSKITLSEKQFSFAAIYLGQHNIIGNISVDMSEAIFEEMQYAMKAAFLSANLSEVIGQAQHYFGERKFSISHLFKDKKQSVLHKLLNDNIREVGHSLRQIYEDNYQLMSGLLYEEVPIPSAYKTAVAYVLNQELTQFIFTPGLSIKEFQRLIFEFKKWKVKIADEEQVAIKAGQRLYEEITQIELDNRNIEDLQKLNTILAIMHALKFSYSKVMSQNLFFKVAKERKSAKFNDPKWSHEMAMLGKHLNIALGW